MGAHIPPLPATQQEIKDIHHLLKTQGWHIQSFEKLEANEIHLKSVSHPQVLHIATHGYFIPQSKDEKPATASHLSLMGKTQYHRTKIPTSSPLIRSGLLLAGASQTLQLAPSTRKDSEGIFSAYDASNLNLVGTELVVLSACETAEGEVVHGEGIYGLQRAFLLAGARTVICSLWKVSDEATRRLMVQFYEYWVESRDVRTAFKQAQQELRKTYPHPFYWGAFVVLGG